MIDPEFELYLRETSVDAMADNEIAASTDALDSFFEGLELERAVGSDARQVLPERDQGHGLLELRDFVNSEKRAAERGAITKAQVKGSLSALRSILGRVIEST